MQKKSTILSISSLSAEMPDDITLMKRVAKRDGEAFRMLADRYSLKGLRFATRLLGHRELAEDVLQETFEAVWKQAPTWQPNAQFTTWFHSILINTCRNKQRDKARFHGELNDNFVSEDASAEETLIHQQRSADVRTALDALPERQKLAVILFYYEGFSQQDACNLMGIQVGAFESLLSRARATLKQTLTPQQLH